MKPNNHKAAPYVNMTYCLAIIIEGISADLSHKKINELSSIIRSKIPRAVASEFGDWTDVVEEAVLQFDDNEYILRCLIFELKRYMDKFVSYFRRFDPNFEFYQKDEVLEIYRLVEPTYNKDLAKLLQMIAKS